MTRLTIRLDFESGASIGPGKIGLLEAVARTGSIRKAAAAMNMGFRQAWLLLQALEAMFGEPLVVSSRGGHVGGGTTLSALGEHVIAQYRTLEKRATAAAEPQLINLSERVRKRSQIAPKGKSRIDRRPLRRN